MKIPFIVLHHNGSSTGGGMVVVQVQSLIAFGNVYGNINNSDSFVQISPNETADKKIPHMQDGCFVVKETPEEIMALIDKAQALVHALDNG